MAANIADIRSKVASRIQDAAGKLTTTATTGDVDRAIVSALAEYQQARPRLVSVVVAGNGGFDYAVSTLLTAYKDGFSAINLIVAPYDSTAQGFVGLDADDFEVVRLPAGLYLRLLALTLTAAQSMLVEYTAPHTLTTSTSTIPEADDEAFSDLAAAECCESLAAAYQQSMDSTIAADAVDYKSKSREYRDLAKSYRDRYERKLGLGDAAKTGPASVHVDVDRRLSDIEASDLTLHGRRRF